MRAKVGEVGGVAIWYEDGRFSVDGLNGHWDTEGAIRGVMEVRQAWEGAEEVTFMRIEYPYLSSFSARFLRLRRGWDRALVGRWYSKGEGAAFDPGTGTESREPYPDSFPQRVHRPDSFLLFDRATWDKAKEVFVKMRAAFDWQQSVVGEKPKAEE